MMAPSSKEIKYTSEIQNKKSLQERATLEVITYHTLRIMTAPPSTEIKYTCIISCKRSMIRKTRTMYTLAIHMEYYLSFH